MALIANRALAMSSKNAESVRVAFIDVEMKVTVAAEMDSGSAIVKKEKETHPKH
jgi:hypothetical protein